MANLLSTTVNGSLNVQGSSMYVTASQLHIGKASSGTAQMSFESWGSYTGAIAMNSSGAFHWGGQGNSEWYFKKNSTYNGDYSASGTTVLRIASDGNIYSAYYGDWLSNVFNSKQNASTAITTSNIGSQSVNYANSSNVAEFQSIPDYRGNAYPPNAYNGQRVWWHFNNTDTVGGYGTYWHAIQTVSPWTSYDSSHRQQQIQWGGTDISFRYATSGTTWSSWFRFITDANIASQSVNYAASAGNANTLDSLDSSDFARGRAAYQVMSLDDIKQPGLYQYDGGIGGTQPEGTDQANLRTIEIGSGSRYSQMAFDWASDQAWFRRQTGDVWSTWREFIHSGNIASQSVSYAASAGSVAWGNVSSKPGNIMYYQGFELNANTMDSNSTGFTYANNAPFYGPIARFSTGGGYDLWIGGAYTGGNAFYLRTRNGDTATLNPWREIITSGNIASQSVNYAASAGSADEIDGWGFRNTGSNDSVNADDIASNGITYYTAGVSNFSGNATDGALYSQAYSNAWQHQIAGDYRSGQIALRGKNNGTWTGWRTVIDSGNIGSQSVNYASSAGNSATTSQIVFSDLKTNFPSGAGGGHSFASNHYSMGLDVGNGAWSHPHYRDVIIGYHTGIRIGANYSGIRFYNNSPTTDANNDGNGDGGEALLMTIGGYVGTANHTDVVVNNNLFANVSMRAPIFYDSNNTYYYVDPNSTSRLVSTRIIGGELRFQNGEYYNNLEYWGARMYSQDDGNGVPLYFQVQWVDGWRTALKIASGIDENNPTLRSYGITQLATNGGNVVVGGTAASDTSNLKLDVQGNMAIRGSNGLYFGVTTNNINSWSTRIYASGSTQYFNAQTFIFDNQGYGGTTFVTINGNGIYNNFWYRNYGNQGMYNESYGTHFYSNGSGDWSITGSGAGVALAFRSNHQSTIRGYVHADTSNQIGFLNNGGGWSFRTNSSLNAFIHGTDLTINADNAGSSNIYMNDGDEGMRQIHCNSNRIGFLTQGGSWGSWCNDDGSWQNASGMYSPIYYDSNNGIYYGDFSSISSMYGLTIRGEQNSTDTSNQIFLWDGGNTTTSSIGFKRATGIWAEHGYTNGDYNTYFTMDTSGRGWVFRRATVGGSNFTAVNVASISNTGNAQFDGYVNTPAGYVSNGNPWGTSNSAFFPNGITTAGGTNWIYGFTYIGNAPGNGAGHEFSASGTQYSTGSITTPLFLVNNHSDNTKGYRIHNTSGSSVSAMFTNSSNALVIAAGAVDQINLNKKVYVNGVALGVNVTPSSTAGRIDASNDIVAYSSSDERLKCNITPIENAIDKVKSLTGVEFDWRPEYKHAHGYEGHDTGIIAQQVQEVIPSAVRTNDTGFLAVRYEKLIGLLVEGMKEQQAQIEELKAKLDGLTK
jgi:hypothetical protein